MTVLEKPIALVIIILILSLIAERAINWFKLYFGQEGKMLPFFSHKEEDLTRKSEDPLRNSIRDRKILGLNIAICTLIAMLAHANLFELFSNHPFQNLGWKNFPKDWYTIQLWFSIPYTLLGCIFSALCMSLGSKFWHDTLDLLFYAKSLKQKLSDEATYKQPSSKQQDQWLETNWSIIVKSVFDNYHEQLTAQSNVVGCGIVSDETGKEFIEVLVSSSPESIPKTLAYRFPDGVITYIPVSTILTKEAVTHSLQKQKAANKERPKNLGTIGLIVHKKDDPEKRPLYLSCYHVLKSENHRYPFFSPVQEEKIIDPTSNTLIGTLIEGVRNDTIDAALCTVENLPSAQMLTSSNGIRVFTNVKEYRKTPVRFYGAISGEVNCEIRSIEYQPNILYTGDGNSVEFHRLHNLIALSNSNGAAPSVSGDSGAILTDTENRIIGMLVAGNGHRSFAIPISTILSTLNLEIPS